jgi:hypothetical protein
MVRATMLPFKNNQIRRLLNVVELQVQEIIQPVRKLDFYFILPVIHKTSTSMKMLSFNP